MKFRIAFFIFLLPIILNSENTNSAYYLEGRIPLSNGRYPSFKEALTLMTKRNVQVIVETGTERWLEEQYCFDGDGGGTIILSHWAMDHGAYMYSVDINETHLYYASLNTKKYANHLCLVLEDSVSFLERFPTSIDFLYLDSYDYDEKNPLPAQQHCLREIQAAEHKLKDSSIVMIDDCNIPGGGKGLLAIKYLLSKGWILHKNHHQVLLIQP